MGIVTIIGGVLVSWPDTLTILTALPCLLSRLWLLFCHCDFYTVLDVRFAW